ncbi:hypothetical protein BT63DRAFT_423577 [Microthyrium microscopicum]|uniref:Uncharacterized protein n=1 Tax=Microthyrium microscopicum TaxID=703497 RepID=A0A6A6UHU6_9PEZI|nr:hypothetical protein BT63DRAFT_423577 [Microthyrium microscopicum]
MAPNNTIATARRAEQQQIAQQDQAQRLRSTETQEYEAKASAQAGLNLNIFAALSGVFSGKKTKTTDRDADGKEHSVEHSVGHGKVRGAGHGTLNAVGRGEASERVKHTKTDERLLEQSERHGTKQVESSAQFDHLGLEGPPSKK